MKNTMKEKVLIHLIVMSQVKKGEDQKIIIVSKFLNFKKTNKQKMSKNKIIKKFV